MVGLYTTGGTLLVAALYAMETACAQHETAQCPPSQQVCSRYPAVTNNRNLPPVSKEKRVGSGTYALRRRPQGENGRPRGGVNHFLCVPDPVPRTTRALDCTTNLLGIICQRPMLHKGLTGQTG
jgi:hypothetical protein